MIRAQSAVKRRELTFAGLAARYLTEHPKPHKRSWKEDARPINAHLLPRFGTRRVSDVRPDEIVAMQNLLKRERGLYESNRVAVLIHTMFNIARDMSSSLVKIPRLGSSFSARISANGFSRLRNFGGSMKQ